MPFNISQGSTVEFSARFRDASGAITTPSSGTLSIAYPTAAGGTAVASVGLTLNAGQVYTGFWDASVSAFGDATLTVLAPGLLTPVTAILRVGA